MLDKIKKMMKIQRLERGLENVREIRIVFQFVLAWLNIERLKHTETLPVCSFV